MIERSSEVHIGNQIIERQLSDALYNFRTDHSRLSSEVIERIQSYVDRYPDFRSIILQRICTANWTETELESLLR